MKRFLLIPLLLAAVNSSSQQKYLVSPNQEVIPIDLGRSAASVIAARMNSFSSRNLAVCSDQFYFGYPKELFPTTDNFGSYHADVIGQWFVAKATGTIDTIFWEQFSQVGALDSTVFLRVHRSLIGPDYGPGIRPGPFPPPCQNWGYWMNSNDLDQGIAAFIEDATDSNWVSTINGSLIPSTPHLGEELWGLGGYAVQVKPATVNFVPMDVLGDTIGVTVGDRFFVSFRIPTCPDIPSICHDRTEWGASGFTVTTADEDYPSRLWKFYEHDRGASNCSGIPRDSVRRGWVARGGFTTDTLDVAVFNIWYSMTVITNVPPVIVDPAPVTRTLFDGGPPYIGALVTDCDPANPSNAGVQSVKLMYEIDGVLQPEVPMIYLGGDYWECVYPPTEPPATVTYRIKAVDLDGAFSTSPSRSFNVVPFGKHWYGIDTGIVCVPHDISATGTEIDTSEFFDPLSPGLVDRDDGIAGPFDLGGTMVLFGGPYRYAWVSVDGAIGLGSIASDTVKMDRGSMGQYFLNMSPPPLSPGIDVPVIAPMWSNFMVGDTAGQYGVIRYGNNGDPCLFVVEWDSIGMSPFGYLGIPDVTNFRAVLNRCEGTVEFQYPNVGSWGYDSSSIVGMQAEPLATPEYTRNVFVNRMGYPLETRPRNDWCIRFYPRNPEPAGDRWNLVSISVLPNDGDYSAGNLFPGGPVYDYIIDYNGIGDSLRPGRGYWMKKLQPGIDGAPGVFIDSITVPVQDKWNLVGGTSGYVLTGSVIPTGGTVSSNYFGYGTAGYHTAATLQPGKGYWVKMSGAGFLEFHSSAAAPKLLPDNSLSGTTGFARWTILRISDASGKSQSLYVGEDAGSTGGGTGLAPDASMFELPPRPPGEIFDARFSSGTMLEWYRGDEGASPAVFPLTLSGWAQPITIRWDVFGTPAHGLIPSLEVTHDGIVRGYPMKKEGAVTVDGTAHLAVIVSGPESDGLPAGFGLSSNYPNPFNPSTSLDYTLPVGSRVTIAVFNIAGEEVARIADGEMPVGYHSARWDGAGSPSGVYYCRMTAGSFRSVRKMLLLK